MIEIEVRPIPGTRSMEKGILWEARCQYRDSPYSAKSRSGAVYALCRVLVSAGADGRAVATDQDGYKLLISDIRKAAQFTLSESSKVPLKLEKYDPFEGFAAKGIALHGH